MCVCVFSCSSALCSLELKNIIAIIRYCDLTILVTYIEITQDKIPNIELKANDKETANFFSHFYTLRPFFVFFSLDLSNTIWIYRAFVFSVVRKNSIKAQPKRTQDEENGNQNQMIRFK